MSADSSEDPSADAPGTKKRDLLISKRWFQAAVLVVLFGFFILGLLAYRTYSADPPIAERAVDPEGNTVYTGEDVSEGQTIFLSNGLMQYGSIFGHGAYLGPDYTADYLRRSALIVEEGYREDGTADPRAETISDFRTNRYDSGSDTLELTAGQAQAFEDPQGPLRRGARQADDGERPSPRRDHRSREDPEADGLLRVVGLGRGRGTPGP